MHSLSAFIVGVLFGAGLIVSGMTDPSKVIGFLDIAGSWDPSLGLVMGGAVSVGLVAVRVARGRTTTLLGGTMGVPAERQVDRRLILGSLVFGIGWGLAGFCPGPALVAFGAGYDKAAVFTIAMLAGMALFEFAERFRRG
jgi:uncharacterized membrane protein YedE/YeeE